MNFQNMTNADVFLSVWDQNRSNKPLVADGVRLNAQATSAVSGLQLDGGNAENLQWQVKEVDYPDHGNTGDYRGFATDTIKVWLK
jgi:hypothetical protein